MVSLQKKTLLSKDPDGVQHFPGGSNFSRWAQIIFSIETHISCDFPGGGGPDHLSPLWIRTCSHMPSLKMVTNRLTTPIICFVLMRSDK